MAPPPAPACASAPVYRQRGVSTLSPYVVAISETARWPAPGRSGNRRRPVSPATLRLDKGVRPPRMHTVRHHLIWVRRDRRLHSTAEEFIMRKFVWPGVF